MTDPRGPILADTHVFLWYLEGSPRLADSTRELIDAATAAGEPILISAVTLVELRYLAEKGTLTEADIDAVHAVLQADGTGFEVAPMDAAVARAVRRIPREAVGDPWDRMIAATCRPCSNGDGNVVGRGPALLRPAPVRAAQRMWFHPGRADRRRWCATHVHVV